MKTFSYLYFHAITYYLTLSFIFFIYLFCTYLYDTVHYIEIKWRDSLGLAKIFRRMMIPHHIFIFWPNDLPLFLFLYIYKPCLLTYLGITCQLTILFFCSVHWFFLIIFRMLVIVLTASTTPFVNLVLQVRDIDACVLLDLQDPIANKVRHKNVFIHCTSFYLQQK